MESIYFSWPYSWWKPTFQRLIKLMYEQYQEKMILYTEICIFWKAFHYMCSTFGFGSFFMDYCINAVCYGGDQPVALYCYRSQGCFYGSLQLVSNPIKISQRHLKFEVSNQLQLTWELSSKTTARLFLVCAIATDPLMNVVVWGAQSGPLWIQTPVHNPKRV